MNRKTLTFCAQRLAVSNKRLDQAYYTLTLLKENGEPVPVEAVNAIIVACAIRCLLSCAFWDWCVSSLLAPTALIG